MEDKKSIFIRTDSNIELPNESGNYLTTLEYPDGTLVVKKVFFLKEFKLKNGKSKCNIINWFKRIEISNDLYDKIINENK